ncbi:hypothetical protein HDV00_007952 [Rhizophlyctis rosea]|nr:hypothetical protein HDV00_007952 [Rhizophlyctis rosea]
MPPRGKTKQAAGAAKTKKGKKGATQSQQQQQQQSLPGVVSITGWVAQTTKQQLVLFDKALTEGEADISNHLHFLHTQWASVIQFANNQENDGNVENYTKIFKTPGKRKRVREEDHPSIIPMREPGLFDNGRQSAATGLEFSEPTSTARALQKTAVSSNKAVIEIPPNETARLSLERETRLWQSKHDAAGQPSSSAEDGAERTSTSGKSAEMSEQVPELSVDASETSPPDEPEPTSSASSSPTVAKAATEPDLSKSHTNDDDDDMELVSEGGDDQGTPAEQADVALDTSVEMLDADEPVPASHTQSTNRPASEPSNLTKTITTKDAASASLTRPASTSGSLPLNTAGGLTSMISLIEQERLKRERDLQLQITSNPAYLKAKEALERVRSASGGGGGGARPGAGGGVGGLVGVSEGQGIPAGGTQTKGGEKEEGGESEKPEDEKPPQSPRRDQSDDNDSDEQIGSEDPPIMSSQGTDGRESWHDAVEFRTSVEGRNSLTGTTTAKHRRSTLTRVESAESAYTDAESKEVEMSIVGAGPEEDPDSEVDGGDDGHGYDGLGSGASDVAQRKDNFSAAEGEGEKVGDEREDEQGHQSESEDESEAVVGEKEVAGGKKDVEADKASDVAVAHGGGNTAAGTRSLWGGGLFGALASTTRSLANLSTQSTFIPVVKEKPPPASGAAAGKPKVEIKALQAAAHAARKEQQDRERRAHQREAQAERARLAMQRNKEEEARRAEELRRKEEEKRVRSEALLAQKRMEEEQAKRKRAEKMKEMAERQEKEKEKVGKEGGGIKPAVPKSRIPTAQDDVLPLSSTSETSKPPAGTAKHPSNEWEEIIPSTPLPTSKKPLLTKPTIVPVSILKTPAKSSSSSSTTIIAAIAHTAPAIPAQSSKSDLPTHRPVQNPILTSLMETPDGRGGGREWGEISPSTGGSSGGGGTKRSRDFGKGKGKKKSEEGPTGLVVDEDGNFPEPPSDYSTDTESEATDSGDDMPPARKKQRNGPAWADTPEITRAILRDMDKDPDALFADKEGFIPIEEVFNEGLRNKKVSKARRSTAFTGADKLTEEEIEGFRKTMGYK